MNLDSELGVTAWQLVPSARIVAAEPVDPDAPLWWHGDEEASQPFMAWAKSQGWTDSS